MPAVTSVCRTCDRDIMVNETDASQPIPEVCKFCIERESLAELLGELLSFLEDHLAANPHADLRRLADKAQTYDAVKAAFGKTEEQRRKVPEGELPGVVPELTHPQIRAAELMAAQDQRSVIQDRVKEREKALLTALHEAEVAEITIQDSIGRRRTYSIEELERIKTTKERGEE